MNSPDGYRQSVPLSLFHRVSECLPVTADPIIPGDEGDQLRRLANFCRRGQVNRIECADGLDRIGSAGAHQNGFGDTHDVAASPERPEPPKRGAFVLRTESTGNSRTHEASGGLGESQGRGDPAAFAGDRALRSSILLEQSRE